MRAHGVALLALTLLLFAAAVPSRVQAEGSTNPSGRHLSPAVLASTSGAHAPEVSLSQTSASGDVRVHYRVDWTVPSRYDATVIVTNMTTSRIDDWTLEFDLFPIADRMNGVEFVVDGSHHTVRGVGPMRSIEPGGMVWFTFSAEWTGSSILVPAVCVFNGSGCTVETLSPPPANPQTEVPVEIAYWVSWQGITQFRSQILIKNVSDDPIDFWNLQFTSDAIITEVSHASSSRTGVNYDMAGKGWTRRIEPGQIVWVTLDGVYEGTEVPEPDGCVFNGFECEFLDPSALAPDETPDTPFGGYCTLPEAETNNAKAEDIALDFQFKSLWATGYTAAIDIVNNATDRPLRDWKLEFELPVGMTVTLFWNGDLTKDGTHYTVTSLLHNSCVEPGVTIQFGFEGRHNGAPVKPTMCSLDGSSCVFARFASATAIENEDTTPSSGFLLEAPYPNPFQASAVVPFRVDRSQHVELTVWDLQGRLVSTPYSGIATAGSTEQARIDGRDLAPGAYILRLMGDDGRSTSRQLLYIR